MWAYFFQNFDGLDSFSEASIKSPLKGESQRKRRQQLYKHLLSEIDDINMILYFGQLKLIAGKFYKTSNNISIG